MALKAALAGLLLAGLASAAEARTVREFIQNPHMIGPKLAECQDDEAVARRPDCANAQRAADWLARRRRVATPRTRTPDEMLSSPRYYAESPLARAITLDRCNRGMALASDCAAARAAGR